MAVHGDPPRNGRIMHTSPTSDSRVFSSFERDRTLPLALLGLFDRPRTLPPHLFYDARGAALFEEITQLDEYYLTRAEREILRTYASDIASVIGKGSTLIEYGSGAATKVRLLLDAMAPKRYIPIDVSQEQLLHIAEQLTIDYPNILISPILADFTAPFELPADLPLKNRTALFLGSTIGNFHPCEAQLFLQRVAQQIGIGGTLLLGVDLRKAPTILHAAYNDSAGVTAAFNRNILEHIRRNYHVIVHPETFAHYAFFNPVEGRVEMHLLATKPTDIILGDHRLHFSSGEGIWTESSYKYTPAELGALAKASGFELVHLWTDRKQWFAVAALVSQGHLL
jgi:dimethylhistidine N-methyltransferase